MQRCTGSYAAEGNDGRSYSVEAWVNFTSPDDPTPEVAGFRTLCTSDGQNLNYIQKGRYQIVATGVVLQSDDPDAP